MSNNNSAIDNKKQQQTSANPDGLSNAKDYINNVINFLVNLIIHIIYVFVFCLWGTSILYTCKLAQSNILPTDRKYKPYQNDDAIKYPEYNNNKTDINIFNTENNNEPISMKISFPYDEPNQKNLFINFFPVKNEKKTVKNYVFLVIQQLIEFNYSFINNYHNILNENFSETIIMLLGPFLAIFINLFLFSFSNLYLVYLMCSEYSYFMEQISCDNQVESEEPVKQSGGVAKKIEVNHNEITSTVPTVPSTNAIIPSTNIPTVPSTNAIIPSIPTIPSSSVVIDQAKANALNEITDGLTNLNKEIAPVMHEVSKNTKDAIKDPSKFLAEGAIKTATKLYPGIGILNSIRTTMMNWAHNLWCFTKFIIMFIIILCFSPLITFVTFMWCSFSCFGYNSQLKENDKLNNITFSRIFLKSINFFKIMLTYIISFFIITDSFNYLGTVPGIFCIITILLIYFNIIHIPTFKKEDFGENTDFTKQTDFKQFNKVLKNVTKGGSSYRKSDKYGGNITKQLKDINKYFSS